MIKTLILSINTKFPHLQKLIPYRLKRYLLLKIYPVDKEFFNNPDRIWMEKAILPAISKANITKVLFVGCAPYTCHYEKFFTKTSIQYMTVDIEPRARKWGAKKHLTCPIQSIHEYTEKDSFDIVLLNGVFGYGVDDVDEMKKTLKSIHYILKKPDGILFIGWNVGLTDDPLTIDIIKNLYKHESALDFPKRKSFENSSHVYDIFHPI